MQGVFLGNNEGAMANRGYHLIMKAFMSITPSAQTYHQSAPVESGDYRQHFDNDQTTPSVIIWPLLR